MRRITKGKQTMARCEITALGGLPVVVGRFLLCLEGDHRVYINTDEVESLEDETPTTIALRSHRFSYVVKHCGFGIGEFMQLLGSVYDYRGMEDGGARVTKWAKGLDAEVIDK